MSVSDIEHILKTTSFWLKTGNENDSEYDSEFPLCHSEDGQLKY